jgi:hypothetical protein
MCSTNCDEHAQTLKCNGNKDYNLCHKSSQQIKFTKLKYIIKWRISETNFVPVDFRKLFFFFGLCVQSAFMSKHLWIRTCIETNNIGNCLSVLKLTLTKINYFSFAQRLNKCVITKLNNVTLFLFTVCGRSVRCTLTTGFNQWCPMSVTCYFT